MIPVTFWTGLAQVFIEAIAIGMAGMLLVALKKIYALPTRSQVEEMIKKSNPDCKTCDPGKNQIDMEDLKQEVAKVMEDEINKHMNHINKQLDMNHSFTKEVNDRIIDHILNNSPATLMQLWKNKNAEERENFIRELVENSSAFSTIVNRYQEEKVSGKAGK